MAEACNPAKTSPMPTPQNNESHLKFPIDGGFFSGEHPPDTPMNSDSSSTSDSENSTCSNSKPTEDLVSSFRVFTESMLRMRLSEVEMMKQMEKSRIEADKKRVEVESQLNEMMLRTHLQVASFVQERLSFTNNNKRKRSDSDDVHADPSHSEGAMLLSLLQCSFIL